MKRARSGTVDGMAGIGFELYKILREGTLSSALKAFLFGTAIVSGPWILSILCIYFIQRFAAGSIAENPLLFNVTIVHTYAYSLFFFGGLHYVFSRYIADRLYEDELEKSAGERDRIKQKITSSLLSITLLTVIISILMVAVFIRFNDFSMLRNTLLYKVLLYVLFVTINIIWILLIYVSLLKEYTTIFIAYLTGMSLSFAGVYFEGMRYGVAGALAGYTAGQLVLVLLLIIIAQRSYPIKKLILNLEVFSYFKKFIYLFLTGTFFNMAIWIDKIIFWYTRGKSIPGTRYYYYTSYDTPTFIAFLTMIPGLVYFLIVAETLFHRNYFSFIKNIIKDTLPAILEKKERMITAFKTGFSGLVIFQGVWTGLLLLNRHSIAAFSGLSEAETITLSYILASVFFHLTALVTHTYLMYLELRFEAFMTAFIFFSINMVFALTPLPAGIGYLAATAMASIYAVIVLLRKLPEIDFIIFMKT